MPIHLLISSITKTKITSRAFIIWIAVTAGIGFLISEVLISEASGDIGGSIKNFMTIIIALLAFITFILHIYWAFKAKHSLQEYALNEHRLDLRMNVIYLVIFNVYYINYCINNLPVALRKQSILC